MPKTDPRVDAYIEKSADFARPILARLRRVVHRGCPDVVETIKWGMPSFEHHGILCGMAAFQRHCTFGFWNRALEIEGPGPKNAMGQFGRITSLSALPNDSVLVGYVREAARLNETGRKVGPERRKRAPIPVPKPLTAALKKKPGALEKFGALSPSQQRDYSEWIAEAKTDATRDKRIATSVDWISQGKPRMWKYMKASLSGAKARRTVGAKARPAASR
jgi:uncharacterized protein YdeI (YjbR/CyaY-like superfamily)